VVVLNNGSALDMREWIDEVDAVLEAWLPGQAGAGAISDILYGKVNPSAKVGETFPLKLQDIPAQLNFPGEGNEVRYGEGLYVGYRAFEAMGQAVLFPFGFGLSYTQFAYSDLQVSATAFGIADALEVSLNVTNVGAVAGQEVVQVYVHDVAFKLKRPYKELKAFTKVSLAPQETKRVTLTLNDRAFSYYHPAYGQWIAEAGAFDILVGSSSADIHLSQQVELTQGTRLPSLLNEDSLLSEWMEDPQGAALVQPLLDSTFKDVNEDDLGVNMVDFFKDLPLKTLLGFNGASLEQSPEVIVRDLLSKITA
jgi:beta-glucosidase